MRLALDAMGGSAGPGPIVTGAARAVRADKHLRLTVVGHQTELEDALIACDGHHPRLRLFPTSQRIDADDDLLCDFRLKPDASVVRLWQLWLEQKVEAIIGTGSATAFAAAGMRVARPLPHVRSPGLGAFIGTSSGPALLIDIAADPKPSPDHLFQFGAMGLVYSRHVLDKPHPTVALLIAGEELERQEETRQTIALFKLSHLAGQFLGAVTPQELQSKSFDVLICSRKAVRTAEILAAALPTCAGPFLGMEYACLWCSDASTPAAVQQAIDQVTRQFEVRLNEQIVKELEAGPLMRHPT
jgi:glycerol-3-phosphate acyltransferase PlsX